MAASAPPSSFKLIRPEDIAGLSDKWCFVQGNKSVMSRRYGLGCLGSGPPIPGGEQAPTETRGEQQ